MYFGIVYMINGKHLLYSDSRCVLFLTVSCVGLDSPLSFCVFLLFLLLCFGSMASISQTLLIDISE